MWSLVVSPHCHASGWVLWVSKDRQPILLRILHFFSDGTPHWNFAPLILGGFTRCSGVGVQNMFYDFSLAWKSQLWGLSKWDPVVAKMNLPAPCEVVTMVERPQTGGL